MWGSLCGKGLTEDSGEPIRNQSGKVLSPSGKTPSLFSPGGQGLAKAGAKGRAWPLSPTMLLWDQQFLPLWTSRSKHREG